MPIQLKRMAGRANSENTERKNWEPFLRKWCLHDCLVLSNIRRVLSCIAAVLGDTYSM